MPAPLPPWLIALESCPSTSTWALQHHAALVHGAVVWTTRQTAGRGRDGRTWHAPPGVLTASVLLRPDRPGDPRHLALAAGLAVAHAVNDLAPEAPVTIKWPNDCLLHGRKLAGILCEVPAGGSALVVGLGMNVDPDWSHAPEAAALTAQTAALAEVATPPTLPELLATLRRYLLEAAGVIATGGFARLLPALRARDALLGRPITVRDADRTLTGTAAGLDDDGALRLDTGRGIMAVRSGHVVER